jgi:excisionase family DNA binding protein
MDKLLTLQEMAEHLSVSAQTFRREVKQRSIPHILVGKRPTVKTPNPQ